MLTILGALLFVAGLSLTGAAAQPAARPRAQAAPLHPQFALLDANAVNVLTSGQPVSTLETCGACHDTAFIQSHSDHASLGLDEFGLPGTIADGRTWDTSPGDFGRWDPLRYRYLSPAGDPLLDLGTPEWVTSFGDRHVGGGPALYARNGRLLNDLPVDASNPETAVLDPITGEATSWDWTASGGVEMNCFLCHLPDPNNDVRIAALQDGAFRWANTATLVGTGLVESTGNSGDQAYRWNPAAFDAEGQLKPEFVTVQDPTNANCGQCHGLVHTDAETPVTLTSESSSWADLVSQLNATLTTGQIIAGQKIADSGMNLAGKADLMRPWDVHAARQVKCTDCHFSLNNPVYFQESAATRPDHLAFDPRRLDLGEYLQRPMHDFAGSASDSAAAQDVVAPELPDTLRGEPQDIAMRRCDNCHNAEATHQWLPYTERHLDTVACETCHIPKLYAPALQSVDWTVLTAAAEPRREYRGVDGDPLAATSLVEGFQPALLLRQEVDGNTRLAPHNLVTAWYWIYGDPVRPVRLLDLKAAWFEGEGVAPGVLAALDANEDGVLAEMELVLDTAAKQAAIAARLTALGLPNPRIVGDVQPYTISHDVVNGEWVTRECTACHGDNSRLVQPFTLAAAGPTGVTPALLSSGSTPLHGELTTADDGTLRYQEAPEKLGLYIFGQSRVSWVDWFGILVFVGVLMGVLVHGGLRLISSLRLPKHSPQLKQVYIYTVYERFWHWLQTFTIIGLIFTGLIIHKPDLFGIFAFKSVVQIHNVLAGIVVVNAALSLFYHLTSGEVKQFIPRPYGLFDRVIMQATFYLRGIFKHEPHPFEKTAQQKLNPLQQITYFGLLNVLLPAQIITGALIWGAQRWPDAAQRVGGLPLLAPVHTMIAWLLAAFVVLHVYLTTTDHAPLASIQAMMLGWEDLEVHAAHAPAVSLGREEALKPAQEASHGS